MSSSPSLLCTKGGILVLFVVHQQRWSIPPCSYLCWVSFVMTRRWSGSVSQVLVTENRGGTVLIELVNQPEAIATLIMCQNDQLAARWKVSWPAHVSLLMDHKPRTHNLLNGLRFVLAIITSSELCCACKWQFKCMYLSSLSICQSHTPAGQRCHFIKYVFV